MLSGVSVYLAGVSIGFDDDIQCNVESKMGGRRVLKVGGIRIRFAQHVLLHQAVYTSSF
jgi:hypothetical protein